MPYQSNESLVAEPTEDFPRLQYLPPHHYSTPDLSSNNSSDSTSITEDDSSEDDTHGLWEHVSLLYSRVRGKQSNVDDNGRPIKGDLIAELDGATFGVDGPGNENDPSTNRQPMEFPMPPDREEYDIPHFPPLTRELKQDDKEKGARNADSKGNDKKQRVFRTSEPIATGIQKDSEERALGHITLKRFQHLLDSPVGKVRFREWVHSEGYSGTPYLLQYHEDTIAQIDLMKGISSISGGINDLYFSSSSNMSPWIQRLLGTRPTDGLDGIDKSIAGLQGAQKEAFEKLYNAEFRRYITGKISGHARFCMEHYKDWHDRGDLATVYCLVDPHQPDQPMVSLSDGFCRLTEYPREQLVGRNCRFLQGPATDPEAVQLLRDAIKDGHEHCSMLMNYTRSGKAFWNLFNMIPLRNAEGGIDYFLGAQVDISKPLTNPTTFQALTGIAEPGSEQVEKEAKARFAFSDDLIDSVEKEEGDATILRRLTSKPKVNAPQTDDAGTPEATRYVRTDRNKQKSNTKLQSQSKPSAKPNGDANSGTAKNPLEPIPIPQEVPNPVRNQMSAFSSAYSKLMVLDPRSRKIMYITAPLLAALGYPVKQARDRLSPKILNKDVLELVNGSPSEVNTVKSSIRDIIANGETHSLFVQLNHARSLPLATISEDEKEKSMGPQEEDPEEKSLLHLTPIKDGKGVVTMYIGVIG